jgi:ketosteroid isomerase-like protein
METEEKPWHFGWAAQLCLWADALARPLTLIAISNSHWKEGIPMPEAGKSQEESLLSAIAEIDQAFSEDHGSDVADLFAEDARLLWPLTEDIVGRESIREALVQFMSIYTTDSFSPNREIIDICGRRAYAAGSFVEIRTPLEGGPTEKVHGRMLQIWQLSSDDKWEIIRFITGRYAETEFLE